MGLRLGRLLGIGLLLLCCVAPPAHAGQVVVAELRGAVSPASAAYFLRTLAAARAENADLVVLTLDTPGGLDTAMRQMIQGILTSPVPVALFVYPGGARAASAGTYLLYASHIAAMAPGTNLGAATPVAIGIGDHRPPKPGDKPANPPSQDPREAKAVEDAAAYLRGLAQLRGRNAEWAEKAVRSAASLSAEEAARMKVVDVIAANLPDLLRRIDSRRVTMNGGATRVLALAGAPVVEIRPNWKERMLAAIADPNIALILLMLGIYGLLFEVYVPGMVLPGLAGGTCLLLALYGLALLSVNFVGVALILLGVGLMVTEFFMPSFGALGIGGIAAFMAGALMVVDADVPGLSVSWPFILPVALLSALAAAGIGFLALRTRRRPSVAGREAMIGSGAEALEDLFGEGWVQAFGERWRARSAVPLQRGARVRIVAMDGLTLIVEPTGEGEKS